jgi:hypothetical protein
VGGGGGVHYYYGLNADLMPGWSVSTGPIGFNLSLAGSGYATIVSPTFVGRAPVIGLYSFLMVPKYDVGGTFVPISLSQSAMCQAMQSSSASSATGLRYNSR